MASTHSRNVGPMHASPRCGAKTRGGGPCQAHAISGKARCRMHGGKGSGAPKGNQNARTHGCYTKKSFQEDRAARELIGKMEAAIAAMDGRIP